MVFHSKDNSELAAMLCAYPERNKMLLPALRVFSSFIRDGNASF